MNAERLHAICLSIQQEINKCNIQQNLKVLVTSLKNAVNQPQHAELQKQIGNALSNFYNQLTNSHSDNFSPGWKQSLDEIGGKNLLGQQLYMIIKDIFERNQITTSIALTEIQDISNRFDKFKDGIDNTVTGLNLLKIGSEQLEQGECEIGFTIPRKAVKNNINEFGKELQELNFIMGTFSEITSGRREIFEIKSISSSDLSVYIAALPAVAACLAYATEKIIDCYKKLLEIRKIKKELKVIGLKDKEIKGITEHANNIMEERINNLTLEIMQTYYIGTDDGRKNELSNALRISLNKISNRIDQGFNIEVRAVPLKEPAENEEKKNQAFIQKIIKAADTLKFLKLEGERVLRLSEGIEKGDETKKPPKKTTAKTSRI